MMRNLPIGSHSGSELLNAATEAGGAFREDQGMRQTPVVLPSQPKSLFPSCVAEK